MSKFILASGSPRRKELLSVAGIEFVVMIPDVDESPKKKEKPQKMVARLCEAKACAVLKNESKFAEEFFILAADTTVVSDRGINLGKPENLDEAFQMLKKLQRRSHFVFTSYCILKIKNKKVVQKKIRTVKTTVTFRKLSDADVRAYLSLNESMDKAGAYAAQGAGMALVSKMNGSYTNVVGLPLSHVIDDLKVMGFKNNE